jgi:hypothetical protein
MQTENTVVRKWMQKFVVVDYRTWCLSLDEDTVLAWKPMDLKLSKEANTIGCGHQDGTYRCDNQMTGWGLTDDYNRVALWCQFDMDSKP